MKISIDLGPQMANMLKHSGASKALHGPLLCLELLVGCLEEVKIVSQMMVVFHGDFFPMGFESVKKSTNKKQIQVYEDQQNPHR